ncbi:MAG: phage holin family protein [Candidatus Gracilibacteria bacterium]|nr:phage holin family protein [Candidatus Gracilibacteria bacterium]
MKIVFSIFINASLLFALSYFMSGSETLQKGIIVPDDQVDLWKTFILGGVFLGIINVTIRPILKIIGLPFYLIFFWLVSLVINGIILKLLTYIMNVLLVIPGIQFEFLNTVDFVIAVAIFTILNMVYSILFFKR